MKISITIKVDDNVIEMKEVELERKNVENTSIYARFFDESCAAWSKDAEYNLTFLKGQQAHANDILRARGYVFLNEVYDMLGMPRTKAGQAVGWIYDESNPYGDNYIDFDLNDERCSTFVNGYERSVLLDFNVDGNIVDKVF